MKEQGRSALSIQELTRKVKTRLESDRGLQNVWVRGEISNFTHHTSGHMYFTLKDKMSRIRAIMFSSYNNRLAFLPREGTRVLARGNVSVYERDGQYQFYVMEMQPDGIGSLYLAYEQLKKKLDGEGLFAEARKRAIPTHPRNIGVITSQTGAAVRDILTTIQRRMPSVSVTLCPVSVQGKWAAPSIVAALKKMNERQDVDVLIVGRGGGSLEELWAFNEEVVARAIAESHIPVISAVGHESDYTIADFVADLRAATPTAAAELAVPHHMELKQRLFDHRQRLYQGLRQRLQQGRDRHLRVQRSALFQQPKRMLVQRQEYIDRLTEQLAFRLKERLSQEKQQYLKLDRMIHSFNPQQNIQFSRQKLDATAQRLIQSVKSTMRTKQHTYQSHIKQLDALSPLKVMQRGYSVTFDEDKKQVIRSVKQVQLGDLLKVNLSDGELDCHVWSMKEEDPDGS